MARKRSWSPPRRSAHLQLPAAPSLSQSLPHDARAEDVWAMAERTWDRATVDHVAVMKPGCTVAGCARRAGTWARCRRKPCRKVIGRCEVHQPTDPMLRARDAHEASHG